MREQILWDSQTNNVNWLNEYKSYAEENDIAIPKEDDEIIESDDFLNWVNEMNYIYLADIRDVFSYIDKKYPQNGYIAIADLGLWNGRRSGYKKYSFLERMLYTDCDEAKWYIDETNDLRAVMYHHDGTNYIRYREWKSWVSDNDKEIFVNKIYNNDFTEEDVKKYTKSIGQKIKKYYNS